ncbi:helix-turn-helix domain-containing protein [Saccharomonospora iraqiensis]|uniref:helix-turn-helix domain-containing protein n=1 Tax=Saccharomonospora iraqiensis TaxID=52698 RepID=UPI00022E898D|nr:hypothetical protein [Saccharomonospora iraqiensis]
MATPNHRFTQARHRTASPTRPDECLSRQELAELVNDYLWRHHQQRVELDTNYIGKIERGVIQCPNRRYREALRHILGVPTDTALGFTTRCRTVVRLPHVDRKQFLKTTALTAGTLALGPLATLLDDTGHPTPTPSRIGATEIDQIRTAANTFQAWDHAYGSGVAREAALAQLRWSVQLLDATCPDHLRADLYSSVAYLAKTAGFMSFDACHHDEAHKLFRLALTCAEEADNWDMRAWVLANMTRQAVWIGKPEDGLTYSEYALVRADRLSPAQQALMQTVRARVFAATHRVEDAKTAVGLADEHFARTEPDDEPSTAFYDAAQHAGHTGTALAELARNGHHTPEATARLSTAISGYGPNCARTKVLNEITLAATTFTTGDPHEATTIGNTALSHADTLRSRRATDVLRDLHRSATRHADLPGVAELQHRINTAVIAT